jgi:hypothetical protein
MDWNSQMLYHDFDLNTIVLIFLIFLIFFLLFLLFQFIVNTFDSMLKFHSHD